MRRMSKPAWTAAAGAFAAVAFLFGAELSVRGRLAPEREYLPILAATAVLAAGAAAGMSLFFSRYTATALAIVPAAALFVYGLLRDSVEQRLPRFAATLAVAALASLLMAWPATRRAGAAALAVGALVALLASRPAPAGPPGAAAVSGGPHPDVILLVMDTPRRAHLTLYGYPRSTSPRLAAYAGRAAVYDDAWSVAPWPPSSHASMLTGLLPAWHGVDGETEPPLPADLLTLPEVLHAAGYRTAGFTANPNLIGPGWEQGFDVYRPPWFRGLHSLIEPLTLRVYGPRDIWRGPGMSARVLRSARRWWEQAGDRDRPPRFLFINLLDPHRPYTPPARDYRTFLGGTAPAVAYAVDQDPVTYHLRPGL